MKKILLTLSLFIVFFPLPLFADESSTPAPDPVSIVLQVETANATLFNGTLTVSPCLVSPESSTNTVNGFCALEQSGLTNVWTWYGDDAFLDSTNGISNDSSLGNYWTWFANLELGPVALNKHTLTTNETLLLAIGTFPLKINVSNTSPETGTPTTITVSKFSFDSSFNPVWLPAPNSTVHVGPYTTSANAEGVATFTATTTDPLNIYATETGFLPTAHIAFTPVASAVVETTTPIPSQPSGGGAVAPSKGDPAAALAFLLQNQQNGFFGGVLQNDWVAIALRSTDTPQTTLEALTPYLLETKELSSVTDYERRAMALEAMGINPYSVPTVIQKIVASFDGAQIGDPNAINDDIFSVFPLMHAGYTTDDEIIKKEINFILSAQESTGAWDNVDLTSAAIQALVPMSDIAGVPEALLKAKEYLKSREDSNGCVGNIYSTSWAIQAIIALGESPSTWAVWGGSTPLSCMALLQSSDGGFGPMEATIESRMWATAYALPALQEKPWNTLLQKFPKQIPTEVSIEPSRETASSTIDILPNTVGIVAGASTARDVLPTLDRGAPTSEVKTKPTEATETPTVTYSAEPTRKTDAASILTSIEQYLLSVMRKVASLLSPS